MASVIGKLSALAVSRASSAGVYGDGGGLYLQVSATGTKSWIFRYTLATRSREMGLGALHTISLAEARRLAGEQRKLLLEGIDPIEKRKADRRAAELLAAKAMTFSECAKAFIAINKAAWSGKHAAQWPSTLKTYAEPVIGHLAVSDIDTGLVLKILKPIWSTKNETASRVRGRIETILDFAKVSGYREGENPARWRGHLDQVLPKRSKVRKVRHHPALPFDRVSAFIRDLRQMEGTAPIALEFTILTAARTGETIGARWPEFDIDEKLWTIPGVRMKGGREHRVPLCDRVIEILTALRPTEPGSAFVFPGAKAGKPLSNMAMEMAVRRMNGESDPPTWRDESGEAVVPHGFRSSFSDFAAERTNFPRDVVEMALSHAVEDEVEAAYRRGTMFQKRVKLMAAWAAFCLTKPATSGKVLSMQRSAA